MGKMSVGVIGATGMVGQNYVRLLKDHPWFKVTHVAASPRSAGKTYAEAVAGRWVMDENIPSGVAGLVVGDAGNIEEAKARCELVFPAVDMDKQAVRELEEAYAADDIPVVSNHSAHRWTKDVPMFIPEVNPHHADIIPFQRQNRGWNKGLIAVKPNCSLQSYLPAVYPLMAAGYPVETIVVTTLQGVSGAGYPGPASIDMIDNSIDKSQAHYSNIWRWICVGIGDTPIQSEFFRDPGMDRFGPDPRSHLESVSHRPESKQSNAILALHEKTIALLDRLPGIRLQALDAQPNTLPFRFNMEDVHSHCLTRLEDVAGMSHPPPGEL